MVAYKNRPFAGLLRWAYEEGQQLTGSEALASSPTAIAFNPEDDQLFVANNVGSLLELSLLTLERRVYEITPASSLSADGDRILAAGPFGASTIQAEEVTTIQWPARLVNPRALVTEKCSLVATAHSGRAMVLDLNLKKTVRSQEAEGFGSALALSPNGSLYALYDGGLRLGPTEHHLIVRRTADGSLVRRQRANFPEGALTFTRDSEQILNVRRIGQGFDAQFTVDVTPIDSGPARSLGRFLSAPFSAEFSADGNRLAVVAGNMLAVYDWPTFKLRGKSFVAGAKLTEVAVNGTGSRIAVTGTDRCVRLFDERARPVAQLVLVGFQDFVIGTPDGFYHCTPDAYGGVGFRLGNRTYPLSQFDLWFNRPDKVLASLGGDPTEASLLKGLYDQRIARERPSHGDPERSSLPSPTGGPILEVEPEDPGIVTREQSLVLRYTARSKEPSVGLDRLYLQVNGVPEPVLPSLTGKEASGKLTISLARGKNFIECYAVDALGRQSLRWTLDVYRKADTAPSSNAFIVAVGVGRYRDGRTLKAATDAADFARLWESLATSHQGKCLVYSGHPLLDEGATLESLQGIGSFLEQADPEDTVAVFLAGHGSLLADGTYAFELHDCNASNIKERGAPLLLFQEALRTCRSRRKLMVLDSCHSGGTFESGRLILPVEASGSSQVSASYMEDLFGDLESRTGAVVISASRSDGVAIEVSGERNGLLTAAVLRALGERKGDRDGDGHIQCLELKSYVNREVLYESKGLQRPTATSIRSRFDFAVF